MSDVDDLLQTLANGTPVEQRSAALRLGAMRNPLVAPELIRAAATDDRSLRTFIASALATLGGVEPIRPALAHPDERVRLTGIAALRHVSAADGVPLLIPLLQDEHKAVCIAAGDALRAHGTPAALTALNESSNA